MDSVAIAKEVAQRLKFAFPYDIEEWITSGMSVENYHKHTTWSNLVQIDSATSIGDFMKKADENNCQCYFSGEHGYPGEWLYCYDICKNTKDEGFRQKAGLSKPMRFRYSAELYWVKDNKQIFTETYTDKNGEEKTREHRDATNCHIVVVARNYNAMRKLNYITTLAHDEGFYFKPRTDIKALFELSPEDVYITSACVAGWKYEDAEEIWLQMWRHFGNSFFLEYQANNTDRQKEINQKIFQMSMMYGIQTIVGMDTHYLDEEDRIKRDNLLIRKGISYPEESGWYMDFPDGGTLFQRMVDQNVLPVDEIIYAMMNTHVFVNGCEELEYNTDFKIPILPEYQNMTYAQRSEVLLNILNTGFENEDDEHRTPERRDGMMYEYGEIARSDTTDYFLDNYQLVNLAIKKYGGQLTTTSRGSASSYYSCKLLGFTTIDRFEVDVPIYPERFITEDRIKASHQMPDIDMNVSSQEPFVAAARELCGEHGCYPLLAVGKLGEKSGFKLYASIKGIDPQVANDITTEIDKFNEARKQVDDEEDLKAIQIEDYITDKTHLQIFYDSKPYQGIIEQGKVHACGFFLFNGNLNQKGVCGYGDIRYEIGLIRCQSESGKKAPTMVINLEGSMLDYYGYVKDDFLIVDVVGIIHKLYRSIGREVPTVSELRKMVQNDDATWGLYAKGATCCLNQCEKSSTTRKVMRYKPHSIKELSAFIAGIRPGFKSHIDGFISRIPYSNGEKAVDDLLVDSFSYMLYQEAVMKIFSWLGIPMKDSYDTIKKISKKKLKGEALAKLENTLRSHWKTNVGNMDNFEPIYQVIKDSARYSFNSPHAYSMACDSLYEAWMKAHYPSKFYEVALNHYSDKEDKNKIAELEKEAIAEFGFSIAKYRYGVDSTKFTVDEQSKTIYPNLASIKGIGMMAAQDLRNIQGKDFVDIYLSCKGTKVNRTVLTNLVKIGYFEQFGSISSLLNQIEIIEKWCGRSTIPKPFVEELGISREMMLNYASDITKKGNISEKQYTIADERGLIKELCRRIPSNVTVSLGDMTKWQIEVLGYTDYICEELPNRYVVVTELDTTYSPKFVAYCLKNGQTCAMKIHNTIPRNDKRVKQCFSKLPVENGNIIYMKACSKDQRKKKINDAWEDIPGEFDWWVNDYEIVRTL